MFRKGIVWLYRRDERVSGKGLFVALAVIRALEGAEEAAEKRRVCGNGVKSIPQGLKRVLKKSR